MNCEALRYRLDDFELRAEQCGPLRPKTSGSCLSAERLTHTSQILELSANIRENHAVHRSYSEGLTQVRIREIFRPVLNKWCEYECGSAGVAIRDEVAKVVSEVVAEESWWISGECRDVFPCTERSAATEQVIIDVDGDPLVIHNYSNQQISQEQLDCIFRVVSRAYSFVGSNLFNNLKHIVISKPKGLASDADGYAYRQQCTIWLSNLLLASSQIGRFEEVLAHEIGHILSDDKVFDEYSWYSGVPNSFTLKRNWPNVAQLRKGSKFRDGKHFDLDEEVAWLFANMLLCDDDPRWVYRPEKHKYFDVGYLVDSLVQSFDEVGMPLSSMLQRPILKWCILRGDRILYPKTTVPTYEEYYPVIQFRDMFILGVDYQKEDY